MGIATLAIETEKTNFKDLTHQLNNYNEIFNLNSYLAEQGKSEEIRLMKTNETLKSQVLQMKQTYLGHEYKKNFLDMKSNIVFLTIVTFALMFVLVGLHMKQKLATNWMFVGIGVLAVVYLILVISIVRRNAQRRKLNWSQYYWQNIEVKK